METHGTDTFCSLIGIKPLIDEILAEVTDPLRDYLWNKHEASVRTNSLPKFIIISGRPGCGKRALCSAIMNELRRSPWRKSADVYYNDKKVKFLIWFESPWDMELDEYLKQIISNAKLRKDGRDFTVIYFRRFETVCPAVTEDRSRTHEQLIQTMRNELTTTPSGFFLIVAATSFLERIDPEILNLANFKCTIPEFDRVAKKNVLRNLFDAENAEISEENLDLIMKKVGSRAIKCLKIVALEAAENAKSRLHRSIDSDQLDRTRIFIEHGDLPEVVVG